MRLLLVEDEVELAAALRAALHRNDVVLDHVSTIAQAQRALSDSTHDALILDRRLPDGDGLSLVTHLRARGCALPIVMLTARAELADRIDGLDNGADDYLCKPFAVEELLARVRAVLRRPAASMPRVTCIGRLSFDTAHREASVEGVVLELPRRELLVLEALLRRIGRTLLRSALEEAVFGFDDEIQSNTLDAHVSRLRRKLADANAGIEIHGMRGIGYLLRLAP